MMPDDLSEFRARMINKYAYDETDGHFRLRSAYGNRCPSGSIVGYLSKSKNREYWIIEFEGVKYTAHRLAWLYIHGRWPDDQIDHANGIRHDNRISNLRECSFAENGYNKPIHPCNTSGIKNVSFRKDTRMWRVSMKRQGKRHYLGDFNTKELAADFASLARIHLHGEFAHD